MAVLFPLRRETHYTADNEQDRATEFCTAYYGGKHNKWRTGSLFARRRALTYRNRRRVSWKPVRNQLAGDLIDVGQSHVDDQCRFRIRKPAPIKIERLVGFTVTRHIPHA